MRYLFKIIKKLFNLKCRRYLKNCKKKLLNLHFNYLIPDPPEITIEKPLVHSGVGQEAVLVCIVHGEAQPEVSWYRDTMQIDQSERHIIEARGARHSLIIRRMHSQDFGNYTCVADNQLGKQRKTITLTGKPNPATFRSAPVSQWKDRYNITWVVESYTPIEEYRLHYKPFYNEILETAFDKTKQLLFGDRKGFDVSFFFPTKIYLEKNFNQNLNFIFLVHRTMDTHSTCTIIIITDYIRHSHSQRLNQKIGRTLYWWRIPFNRRTCKRCPI